MNPTTQSQPTLGITPEDIIQQSGLHEVEVRPSNQTRRENPPANLLGTFRDPHEVKVYTNDKKKVWLFISKDERRFLLQAPLE